MKFIILQGDKKTVRARLEQITGDKAKYTMAPRFAHVLRGIFLERDGSVTAEEGADLNLCRMLEAGACPAAGGASGDRKLCFFILHGAEERTVFKIRFLYRVLSFFGMRIVRGYFAAGGDFEN